MGASDTALRHIRSNLRTRCTRIVSSLATPDVWSRGHLPCNHSSRRGFNPRTRFAFAFEAHSASSHNTLHLPRQLPSLPPRPYAAAAKHPTNMQDVRLLTNVLASCPSDRAKRMVGARSRRQFPCENRHGKTAPSRPGSVASSANRNAKAGILWQFLLGLQRRENPYAIESCDLCCALWIVHRIGYGISRQRHVSSRFAHREEIVIQADRVRTNCLRQNQRANDRRGAAERVSLPLRKKCDLTSSNI